MHFFLLKKHKSFSKSISLCVCLSVRLFFFFFLQWHLKADFLHGSEGRKLSIHVIRRVDIKKLDI